MSLFTFNVFFVTSGPARPGLLDGPRGNLSSCLWPTPAWLTESVAALGRPIDKPGLENGFEKPRFLRFYRNLKNIKSPKFRVFKVFICW